MKPILTLILAVALGAGIAPAAENPNDLFQQALVKERTEGNLPEAIKLYQRIVDKFASNHKVAARALLQMAECQTKLGDAQARKSLERLVRDFADQKETVATAQMRLAAMGKVASGPSLRLIGKDGRVASASPDGRFLVQWGANDDMELRDLRTGQIRQIAKQPWYGAGVSPDGRQVAFLRWANGSCELRTIGADGSAERLLWRADKGWAAGEAQWFPDGRRIIVAVAQREEPGRVVAISATDGAVTTLWEGKRRNRSDPQLSPDGKSVIYARRVRENPAAHELWLMRLEDRSEELLFEGQSTIGYPRWTPDGTGVVFLSDRRVPRAAVDLWLLRTSGGKPLGFPELLKTDLGQMASGRPIFPAGPITRDGTYYFHRRAGGEMAQLLTTKFDPDTGKAVGAPSFVSRKGGPSRSLSFSLDGRWLAYFLLNPGSVPNLVVQSVESGEERVVPVAPSPVRLDWAVMFPDGRSVLVSARRAKEDADEIYSVDVASGAWTSLKKPGEREIQGFPNAISPDGRTIYLYRWTDGAGNRAIVHLIARNVETGQERELRNGPAQEEFALSPDGKQLAVAHPDGKDLVIDVLPAAGGPKREVCRVPGFQTGHVTWTPDGRYLIFGPSDKLGNSKGYMRVSVVGGEARPIGISASQDGRVQFPHGLGGIRIHPSGRQLVYVANSPSGKGEDWALENFLPKAAK